jgi:hypothetical protein
MENWQASSQMNQGISVNLMRVNRLPEKNLAMALNLKPLTDRAERSASISRAGP